MTYRHRIADWLRVLTAVILLFASVSVAEAQQNVAPAPVIVYQFTGNTGSLAITTTSANVALPAGTPTVYVTNPGPAAACVALGTSGAITAGPFSICPAAQVVPPNQTRAFGIGANTYIAGVADTGTATLTLLVGNFGPSATNGVSIPPSSAATAGIVPVVSASAEASHVIKASAGNLYSVSATNLTTTAGFLVVLNATSAPADGAITPLACIPLPPSGVAWFDWAPGPPAVFSTGITAVLTSASTCFTKTTGVITGFISGSAS